MGGGFQNSRGRGNGRSRGNYSNNNYNNDYSYERQDDEYIRWNRQQGGDNKGRPSGQQNLQQNSQQQQRQRQPQQQPQHQPQYQQQPQHHLSTTQHQTPGSPEGFWPNPDKELFYKVQTPRWLIPKKRKTKGDTSNYFYDLTDEELKWEQGGEITTSNRYKLLEDTPARPTCVEGTPISRKNDLPDFSLRFSFKEFLPCKARESVINNKHVKIDLNSKNENSKFITRGSVMDYSFDSFMNDKNKVNNNSNHFMYQNKYNLCTGYMPSFISQDCNEGYEFTKGNNQSLYYLYTKDGKYLKPLSNNVSKYNNMYFGKMRHAYNISKRHSNQILSDTKRSIPINCTLKPYFINNGKTNINVKNNNSSNNNNSPKLKNNNNNNTIGIV